MDNCNLSINSVRSTVLHSFATSRNCFGERIAEHWLRLDSTFRICATSFLVITVSYLKIRGRLRENATSSSISSNLCFFCPIREKPVQFSFSWLTLIYRSQRLQCFEPCDGLSIAINRFCALSLYHAFNSVFSFWFLFLFFSIFCFRHLYHLLPGFLVSFLAGVRQYLANKWVYTFVTIGDYLALYQLSEFWRVIVVAILGTPVIHHAKISAVDVVNHGPVNSDFYGEHIHVSY